MVVAGLGRRLFTTMLLDHRFCSISNLTTRVNKQRPARHWMRQCAISEDLGEQRGLEGWMLNICILLYHTSRPKENHLLVPHKRQ